MLLNPWIDLFRADSMVIIISQISYDNWIMLLGAIQV